MLLLPQMHSKNRFLQVLLTIQGTINQLNSFLKRRKRSYYLDALYKL